MPRLLNLLSALLLCLVSAGCSQRGSTELEQILDSFIGAELLLPDDSVCSLFNRSFGIETLDPDYLIVSYITGDGCTPCHLKLPYWKEIGMSLDTVTRASAFPLLIVRPDTLGKVRDFLLAADYDYPVIIDTTGVFTRLNSLPDQPLLRTFLIDRSRTILAMGNPVYNDDLASWYLKIISGVEQIPADSSLLHITGNRHDFGTLTPDGEISVCFLVTNRSRLTARVDTIITSCDCITASAEDIAPGATRRIDVTLHPGLSAGAFHHPLIVRYAGHPRPIVIHLYGHILPR